MRADDESRDPLDELAESFLERYRRGENPSITEYVERHPDLADGIRALFPTLCVMEELAPGDDTWEEPKTADDGLPIRQLGEYRLLREIGRGGMGIVFEAEQVSLGRRVALKILPYKTVLDSTQLERFRLEARVAARLHHTNIVPVFGVGKDRGVHYYAMQFIRGHSVAEVLDELRRLRGKPAAPRIRGNEEPAAGWNVKGVAHHLLSGAEIKRDDDLRTEFPDADTITADTASDAPGGSLLREGAALAIDGEPPTGGRGTSDETYWFSVARIGLQVADALAYAHAEGILHRDIKPSNLLLDTRGTVWITDFGLAKTEGSDDLTASGNFVGTLRYMAPERFRGDADARSDVYSLGVTIYELLTLEPAFSALDRGQLVKQVTDAEPVPPRRIDGTIPRDLETIILKAIEKRPASRYASAAELAEDLRRYLHREPVAARRATPIERTWRWCQRNPAIALLSAAVLLLLGTLASGATLAAWNLARERNATLTNLGRALDAESRAMRRLAAAKLEEGRAWRRLGGPGQRERSLAALAEAAGHEPSRAVRNELIGSLALADLEVSEEWDEREDAASIDPRHELAARATNGAVFIEDANEPGRVIATIPIRRDDVRSMSIDPRGRFIAIKYWGNPRNLIELWDIAGSSRTMSVTGSDAHTSSGFAPDGSLFAVGNPDGSVSAYRLPDCVEIARLPRSPTANHLVFSPDARQIAIVPEVAASRAVWVRSFPDGELRARLVHPDRVADLAWHPEGQLIATACFDFTVHVWTGDTFAHAHILRGHIGEVNRVAFDATGEILASTGWDGRTRLWNPWSGTSLLTTPGEMIGFRARDGGLGFRSGRWRRGVWRVVKSKEYRLLPAPTGSQRDKGPQDIDLSPDGRWLAAACMAGGLRIWPARESRSVAHLALGKIDGVRFAPGGSGLITTGARGTFFWPIAAPSGAGMAWTLGPPAPIAPPGERLDLDESGRTLALLRGQEAVLFAFDRDSLQASERQRFRHNNISRVSLSPSGRKLVTVTWHGRGVRIWDVENGTLDYEIPLGSARASITPDERGIVTCTGDSYELYDLATRERVWRVQRTNAGSLPAGIAFSAGGELVAIARSREMLALHDLQTGKEVAVLESPLVAHDLGTLDWSRDGSILVASTGHQVIHRWDLRSIRRRLALLELDWEPPIEPEATREESFDVPGAPVRIEVVSGAGGQGKDLGHALGSREVHALALLNDLIEAEDNPGDIVRRAHILARNGFTLDAIEDFTTALARLGPQPELFGERAVLYNRIGEIDAAVGDLESASSSLPAEIEGIRRERIEGTLVAALKRRAQSRLDKGDLEGATDDLEAILARDPNDPQVNSRLAWIWAVGGAPSVDPSQALDGARAGTRHSADDYDAWRTLAVVAALTGEFEEAAKAAARAREIAADDDPPTLQLADALIHAGRFELDLARASFVEGAEAARSLTLPPGIERQMLALIERVREAIEEAATRTGS